MGSGEGLKGRTKCMHAQAKYDISIQPSTNILAFLPHLTFKATNYSIRYRNYIGEFRYNPLL